MALLFPYRRLPSAAPIVPLGGRMERPRTLIDVTLIGPSATHVMTALLDNGADDTVFPASLASRLGLDLSAAPLHTLTGISGPPAPVAYAQLHLRITDGVEFREWLAWVGFTTARMAYPTLGYSGFLQYFDALFRGHLEEIELAVNAAYPGT